MKCLPQHNSGQREKGHLGQTIDNKRFSIASFQAIAIAIYIAISGLKQVVTLLFITPSFKPAIAISIAGFPMKYSVSSLVVPKMEEGISGTGAVKNS